jgi:glycosyltransferase involved in cell wall biosynthesis
MSQPNPQSGQISKTVLHVLPHPGGGGETYVDSLSLMDGYHSDRLHLAPSTTRAVALRAILAGWLAAQRSARSHDLLHVHGEVASTICLLSLATRPSVVTFNGLHLLRRLDGAARRAAKANLRAIVRAASRTICVSESEYSDVLEVGGTGVDRRVVMIHNGITPLSPASLEERATARAEFGVPEGALTGVWLAGLDKHKDPVVAARAAIKVAREGPLALLVAGDGPLRPELERLALEGKGDVIRVLGHRRDARRVLAAADFFVLSSHREGLSYALLEAMSMGLPPVVSDAPGNPEAVGDAGIVVPRGDVAGFAKAFRRLLRDLPERLALGERARERVAHHFRAEDMVSRTREVYDEVAGHGSAVDA